MIPAKRGNSANKTKAGQAIVTLPEIELQVKNVRPIFKASDPIKIRLNAVCKNISVPESSIEYRWSYSDSAGLQKSYVSKKPVVMLSCPNFFCGRTITMNVKAYIANTLMDNVSPFELNRPLPQSSLHAEDSITLYPTSYKQLAKEALWLPDTFEMERQIQAEVKAFGYNNTEVELNRYIRDKNEIIWENSDKVTVQDNIVWVAFDRFYCRISTTEDHTFTFRFRISDAKTGKLLGDYSKDFIVKARVTVQALNSFSQQPVMIGDVNIVENNFMPCKYTQIDVEYTTDQEGKEKAKVTVFKEGSLIKQKVNIIGGKRKATVILREYTPQKCKLPQNRHSDKKAVLLYNGQPAKNLQLSVSGKTGKIEDVELSYKYKKYDTDMMKFLWLPLDKIQTNKLRISTCRHSHDVTINMLPDIEWEAYLKIAYENPRVYTHVNMPREYGIFERHQKKAMDASKSKPLKIGETEVSFGLAAEYDDKHKIDFAASIKPAIEKMAEAFCAIKKGLDILSFKDTVDANRDKIKASNIAPKSSKIPIFIEISQPSLVLGGGWQYDIDSYNMPIRKGEIAVAASPLIAAKGGIDLIACATYIPFVGQIIKTILGINDFAKWLTNRISEGKTKYESDIWFNLYLSGELTLKGVFEFSEKEKEVKLEAPTTIVLGIELGLKAEISTKTVSIKGETTHTVKAGASGEAKTSIEFEPSIGYNSNDGMFLGLKVIFGGMEITVSGEAEYEKKEDGHKKWSIGTEIEEPYPLIDETPIWEGTLCLFEQTSN